MILTHRTKKKKTGKRKISLRLQSECYNDRKACPLRAIDPMGMKDLGDPEEISWN